MTLPGGRSPLRGPPPLRRSPPEMSPNPKSLRAPPRASSDQLRLDTRRPPSSVPESGDPLRDALVSTRRYGATLNGLLSAIDSFARGVEAARSANDALARRLEALQEYL